MPGLNPNAATFIPKSAAQLPLESNLRIKKKDEVTNVETRPSPKTTSRGSLKKNRFKNNQQNDTFCEDFPTLKCRQGFSRKGEKKKKKPKRRRHSKRNEETNGLLKLESEFPPLTSFKENVITGKASKWSNGPKISESIKQKSQRVGNNLEKANKIKTQDHIERENITKIFGVKKCMKSKFKASKLRDRWWDAIKQYQTSQVAQGYFSDENKINEETHTSSDALISSNSLSLSSEEDNVSDDQREQIMYDINESASDLSKLSTSDFHTAIFSNDIISIKSFLLHPKFDIDVLHEQVPRNSLRVFDHVAGDSFPKGNVLLTPFHLCIHFGRHNILNILLNAERASQKTNAEGNNWDLTNRSFLEELLRLAVKASSDECARVLLSYENKLITKPQQGGDTVFHVCCRYGNISTLRVLLRSLGNANARARLLCRQNLQGQTCFHIACQAARVDIMQELLNYCSTACKKAYYMKDIMKHTPLLSAINVDAYEVVLILLKWEENPERKNKMNWKKDVLHRPRKATSSPLGIGENETKPLHLAVSRGSTEVMYLLLELDINSNDDKLKCTELDQSLILALDFMDDESTRVDMIQTLMDAGADPFVIVPNFETFSRRKLNFQFFHHSAFNYAACNGDIIAMETIISFFSAKMTTLDHQRRLNPDSVSQNHHFLDRKKLIEEKKIKDSLSDALTSILVNYWRESKTIENDLIVYKRVLNIYTYLTKKGGRLDDESFLQVAAYLDNIDFSVRCNYVGIKSTFQAQYLHCVPGHHGMLSQEKNRYSYWSRHLIRMSWFSRCIKGIDSSCPWITNLIVKNLKAIETKSYIDEICYLVVEDQRMIAHKEILSAKSGKFAAALHFSTLQVDETCANIDTTKVVEINLDVSLKMLLYLLQHIYHGSVFFGLPSDSVSCCRDLLELASIAEEFLCPSLLLECEMRLLSSNPWKCACWCCCNHVHDVEGQTDYSVHGDFRDMNSLNVFQCHYEVTSPCKLIDPNTAINAYMYSLERFSQRTDYSFSIKFYANEVCLHQPFQAVCAASMKEIIQNFTAVCKSDAFFEVMESSQNNSKEQDNNDVSYEDRSKLNLFISCLDGISQNVYKN